jgi:hypothetical protein
MMRPAEDKDEQAVLSLDAEFHQRLLIAADMEDYIPLWLAIYGRMRGHHRQNNRRLEDLGVVGFVLLFASGGALAFAQEQPSLSATRVGSELLSMRLFWRSWMPGGSRPVRKQTRER